MARAAWLSLCVWFVGCGGAGTGTPPPALQQAPLIVAAGSVGIEPAAQDGVSAGVDLVRLGLGIPADVYELTTPAGAQFVFDLLTRGDGNQGEVRVRIAHAADGSATPAGGVETIAGVGVVPVATGVRNDGNWLESRGDGFARITLRGAIERDQVFAVEVSSDAGRSTALVRIALGPVSRINTEAQTRGDYPGVFDERTLYSSDSWLFGLPTIAISGDRTTVVAYEGDGSDPFAPQRYEMRLQYDHVTADVTGGASVEAAPDTGHWRDHEVAALFNVLALVHSGSHHVTVKLSFDRGASFGQTVLLGDDGLFTQRVRLAQIAMAADYTVAVLFWRNRPDNSSDLVLVEGRPSSFDGTGSPTRFAFDSEQVLYHDPADVMPLLMGATWSDGGDLVVGYGFTAMVRNPDTTWTSTTRYHCATRLFGERGFTDVVLFEEIMTGKDPSVATLGSGRSMQVFCAYETPQGIQMRVSDDGGATYGSPVVVGDRNAHEPTVFVRADRGAMIVDVLYLTHGEHGQEIHLSHWDDFGRGAPAHFRLTRSSAIETARVPGVAPGMFAPPEGMRITQVSWFGYDAVRDGDDIVVVYDEQTYDAFVIFAHMEALGMPGAMGPAAAEDFRAAEPPPLAPGLTEPVRPPNPDHMHQLKLLRLR